MSLHIKLFRCKPNNDICEFCSKIFTPKESKNWSDNHSEYRYTPTEYNIISKSSNGEFELWNRCDDEYYNGSIIKISYCPKCGRKL